MDQVLHPGNGHPPLAALPPAGPVTPREPATAQALWPTFMRRTLAEDELRVAEPQRG